MMKDVYQIPEAELIAQARVDGIKAFCVGAGIVRDDKVLVVRRVPGFMGGQFEIPGGGVEVGESFEEAIGRETKEEAGLTVLAVIGMSEGFDYEEEQVKTRQFNFIVQVAAGDVALNLKEHDEYRWVGEEGLETLGLDEVMRNCLVSLFQNLKQL